MGTVYDCRDPVIGRRVAIKTVSKEGFDPSESEALLGRFKQEAQAAGRLNHPGVVSIYDYGETGDVAFIAMEYISGKELKNYFDAGEKFDLKQIVRIMGEILDALDHAHRNKVVHRDIKPANIMITNDGRIKVADFGVAKIESSMMTQVGTRVGTPAYMSPEQHKMLSVDGRSDLFSCGVILYQFLTGVRPFTGGSHTIAQQILTQTPIPPSTVNVALPTIWDAIVRKALAKRRDERFSTARDFIEALQHGLSTSPSSIDGLATNFSEGPHDTSSRSSRESGADVSRSGPASSSSRNERTDLQMESELEFWKEIKDSDIAEDFEAFVESFPAGRFSHLAKRRLEKLRQAADQVGQEETALPVTRTPPASTPSPQPTQKRGDAHPGITKPPPDADTGRDSAVRPTGRIDHDAEEQVRRAAQETAEREAKQRQREKAEAQARREAKERAEREAKERAEREAKERAEREAKERAGREAKERARKEADERMQQALHLEATRAAAQTALKQKQEKAKHDAEQGRLSNAEATRGTEMPADPDATEIRPGPGKKEQVGQAPIDDPDATLIRAKATSIRDVDATFIRYRGDLARPKPANDVSGGRLESRNPGGNAGFDIESGSKAVDIDLSDTAWNTGSAAMVRGSAPTKDYPVPVAVRPAASAGRATVADDEEMALAPSAKSRSATLIAGVAVVALAVAGAGWMYLKPDPTPSHDAAEKIATQARTAPTQENTPAPLPHRDVEPKVPSERVVTEPLKTPEAAPAEGLRKLEMEAKNRAAEAAAAEKLVAAKLAADIAAAKSSTDKAATEKLALQKAVADKAVADKAVADRAAADKATADKAAADRAAADRVASAGSIADRIAAASSPAELYKRALALRNEGKASQAVALLRQASSQGHGPSSRLLVTIFTEGAADVRANFREVDRYKAISETQGER